MSKSVQLSLNSTPYSNKKDEDSLIYNTISNLASMSKIVQQNDILENPHLPVAKWIEVYCTTTLQIKFSPKYSAVYKYAMRHRLNSLMLYIHNYDTQTWIDQTSTCADEVGLNYMSYKHRFVLSDGNETFKIRRAQIETFLESEKTDEYVDYVQKVFVFCHADDDQKNRVKRIYKKLEDIGCPSKYRIFMILG